MRIKDVVTFVLTNVDTNSFKHKLSLFVSKLYFQKPEQNIPSMSREGRSGMAVEV